MAKRCFVIMPFSKTSERHTEEYWTNFYTAFLKPRIESFGYTCLRSQAQPSNIIKGVLQELFEADLVVSVLTDYNANVWYELGIRHVLRKGTIMIIERSQPLPFDIHQYGVLTYDDSIAAASAFERDLDQFIAGLEKSVDSPVLEFLPQVLAAVEKQRHDIERGRRDKRVEIERTLETAATEQRSEPADVPGPSRRKILWVDDNPANNLAVLDHYRPLGIDFDLALTTQQALDFLARGHYDLIISDIGRGSDWEAGIQMIPEVRSRFADAPPIVLFAHPDAVKVHAEKAKQLGAAMVTAKFDELVPWIERVLSRQL